MFTPFQRKTLLLTTPLLFLLFCAYAVYRAETDPSVEGTWLSVWSAFLVFVLPVFYFIPLAFLPLGLLLLAVSLLKSKTQMLHYAIILLVIGVIYAVVTWYTVGFDAF